MVAGFVLVDASIALALAGVLALAAAGVTAHLSAARATLEPALQARSSGTAAMAWLGTQIRQAGALSPPATVDAGHPVSPPLTPALSAEPAGVAGERLLIRHESRTDCLGASRVAGQTYHDPARDPPTLTQTNHLYVSRTATGGPSLVCDPDGPGSATAQAFALQIESMHLRFRLRDGTAWQGRAAVTDWQQVQAVEVCLVLTGGRAAACPSQGGAGPWPPRIMVGVFALRNAS
jgi:hypothetical protein